MSFTAKVKVISKILKNLRGLWGGERLADLTYGIQLVLLLKNLGVLEYLETPRRVEEVAEFLGGVKRLDILKDTLTVCAGLKVLVEDGGAYRTNWPAVEEILAKRSMPACRDLEPSYKACETYLPGEVLKVLRGDVKEFISPEVASIYYWQTQTELYRLGREMLLELGGGKRLKGKKIFDLGCGFGVEPVIILEYLDFNCQLVAADFFDNVLDECMNRLVNFQGKMIPLKELENVDFLLLDPSMKEPFGMEDESVDAVFSFQFLHWTHHPREVIAESARILKPGGIVMTSTPFRKKKALTSFDVMLALMGGNRTYTRRELIDFFSSAGLKNIKTFISAFILAEKPS